MSAEIFSKGPTPAVRSLWGTLTLNYKNNYGKLHRKWKRLSLQCFFFKQISFNNAIFVDFLNSWWKQKMNVNSQHIKDVKKNQIVFLGNFYSFLIFYFLWRPRFVSKNIKSGINIFLKNFHTFKYLSLEIHDNIKYTMKNTR